MIYGVDLGTSNCLIAGLDKSGTAIDLRCLEKRGKTSFPSIVYFESDNKALFGDQALQKALELPDQTIEFVKVRLGKEINIQYSIDGHKRRMEPQSITALFLKHIQQLHGKYIKDVVLTVPAYFNDAQKSATKQAGDLAGYNVVEMIDEPSAALMYWLFGLYHQGRTREVVNFKNKNYLVFDFGGGTLDLSLIHIDIDEAGHLKPKVFMKAGSLEVGGKDIDFKFTLYMIEYLREIYSEDMFLRHVEDAFRYYSHFYRFHEKTPPDVKNFIISLKRTIEHCKIVLSDKSETTVEFPDLKYEPEQIPRSEFESQVLELNFKKEIVNVLTSLRNKAHNDGHQVDDVILVGGSAKIPFIRKIIESVFPAQGIHSIKDQELAVSKGAAIIGAIVSGESIEPFGNNRCHNCVAHDLYVGHKNGQPVRLINSGTPIPFEPVHKSFEIGHALSSNIEVELKEVYFGNDPQGEEIIKSIKFYHPFFYTHDEIDVILTVDEFGLWKIRVEHKDTKETLHFEAEKNTLLKGEGFARAKSRIQEFM